MRSILPPSTWLLLVLATVSSAGFGASGLDELDRSVQRSVASGCLSAWQRGGAAAYRRCVTSTAGRAADRAPLAAVLDFDERVALGARCAGADTGADCVRDELTAVEGGRKPYLAFLDADERQALVEQCLGAPEAGGVAGYRSCLDDGLDALESLPPADLSPLALADKATLARRCGGDTDDAAGYRRCLSEALGTSVAANEAPAFDAVESDAPEPAAPALAPAPAPEREFGSASASEPALDTGDGEEIGTDAPLTTLATERERIAADLEERLQDARARLERSVATLDGMQQALLAAALMLPFLLLVGRTAIRGGERRSADARETAPFAPPSASSGSATLADRVAPSMRGRTAAGPLARDGARDRHAGSDEGFDDEPYGTAGDAPAPGEPFVPRSAFGRWLLAETSSLRREHAIEFLVYWTAYGDDRYDARSRRALLERSAEEDRDAHERIKRHALERDTAAFADALRWLQGHTGAVERMQILDLLMALLVTDGAMTPVQNTLLRFVADAFGIPAETLDERHEFAFDAPMPPLPRPDLPSWWEGVDPALPMRWNARALAALDERERYRVQLGLPLGKSVAERRVIEGFRRAARRCQPHRFDALGERERALVERRLAKYEEARDALLGGVTA